MMYLYRWFRAPGLRKLILRRRQTSSRKHTISRRAVTCAPRMESPWTPFDADIVFAETGKKNVNKINLMQGV